MLKKDNILKLRGYNVSDKYLKLSEDIDDIKYGNSKEKATASIKILGKSIFNIAKYAVSDVLPAMIERSEQEKKKMK